MGLMKLTANDVTAQLAHFAWGGWMPFLFYRVFHTYHIFAPAIAVAFVKELLETLGFAPWEPKQTWLSSGIDFAFFALGTGLTYTLFYWAL